MTNNPKVSIIIPVYNGSNFMRCAIDCALNQTYRNIEVIVVNDGSEDDGATDAIARSYGNRIRYYRKENGGVSSALNYGIARAEGDYLAWLSHDDAYTKTRIGDAVRLLAKHEMLGKRCVGFTGGYLMDACGMKIKDFRRNFEADRVYSGFEAMNIMVNNGTFYGCCFLFPQKVFEEVGAFDERLRYSQDALMWYRIFLAGYQLVSDNRPNVMSRMHGAQVSHTHRELFSHDALVISKLLAEPLTKADPTGGLLIRYIQRLTKYECVEAVRYLYRFAEENGFMNLRNRMKIFCARVKGFFRCQIVKYGKKVLIRLKH